MLSMEILFSQILIILIYVATGFTAGKVGLINPEQRVFLSRICSDLILPFTILSASAQELDARDAQNMMIAFVLILAVYLSCIILTQVIERRRGTDRHIAAVETGLITYPNCTFLGLPLCIALFGEIAVLYNVIMLTIFNVLFFTVQFALFNDGKMGLRKIFNPAILTTAVLVVMLMLKLHLPAPVQSAFSSIGSMISPLSLIVIGVMLSENKLSDILHEKRAYAVTLLRNLLVPAGAMVLLALVPLAPEVKVCLLVYLACPCATLTGIYAIQMDVEPQMAVNSVLMSTLFFAVSLPVVVLIGQMVLL